MSEPWVSGEEVPRHLGVAKDTVYRLIETRGPPAHLAGRLCKLTASEVDAWVEHGADSEHRSSAPSTQGERK